jgi:magnesium transporter
MKSEQLDEVLIELRVSLEKDDLKQAKTIIDSLLPPDQAVLVEVLEAPAQVALINNLDPGESANLMGMMHDQDAVALAELLPSDQLAEILDNMEDNVAVDILGELPQEKVAETLQEMEAPKKVIPLLRYPPDTAGGLMTRAVITLRSSWTVKEALAALRRLGPASNSTYYLFITDENNLRKGVIGLCELVTAPADDRMADRMNTEVVTVPVTTDQEECALILTRHKSLALPVVDEIGSLLGLSPQIT